MVINIIVSKMALGDFCWSGGALEQVNRQDEDSATLPLLQNPRVV
jgi:hypothetical protein